jgi:fatty acid desaturase
MKESVVPGTLDTNSDALLHSITRPPVNEYAALKQLITKRKLLDKQPRYYIYKFLFTLGLLIVGVFYLLVVHNFWLQLCDAVYLAFVFGQISFLGHDSGHRQIFHAAWKNNLASMLLGDVLIAMSYTWWIGKHNQHHAYPNQFDMDPDMDIPAICFSQEEALGKQKLRRLLAAYQAYALFALMLFVAIDFQRTSIFYVLRKQGKERLLEVALLSVHYLLYFGLIFSQMSFWQGIVFIFVNQALLGLYMGSIIAPNHKGMPMLEKSSKIDFLRRQVMTARNVYSSPFNDFWYGGLNYQIEHHLFPSMPRNNLKEAQKVIKLFCQAHAISYYETGMVQSYKEILQFLHEIGAPLRQYSEKSNGRFRSI